MAEYQEGAPSPFSVVVARQSARSSRSCPSLCLQRQRHRRLNIVVKRVPLGEHRSREGRNRAAELKEKQTVAAVPQLETSLGVRKPSPSGFASEPSCLDPP